MDVGTSLLLVTLILQCSDPTRPDGAEAAIRTTLNAPQNAWNDGNIPEFMNGYVRDNTLRFASGGQVQRGWDATLRRYQSRYSTREQMGLLTFSDFEINVLSGDAAEVFGRFHLKRNPAEGDVSGVFTLLMRKIGDRWLIQHDHTSVSEPMPEAVKKPGQVP